MVAYVAEKCLHVVQFSFVDLCVLVGVVIPCLVTTPLVDLGYAHVYVYANKC